MVPFVTLQLLPGGRSKDPDPQIATSRDKHFTGWMQRDTAFLSKMNGHFVRMHQGSIRQAEKVYFVACRYGKYLTRSSGVRNFHIANFHSIFGF
jgi:hypothetical protein